MESELAACPVCRSSVTQPGNSDVYCVDCNYKNHVGDHNALARRAEIGALVERMMSDPRSVALRFGSAVDLTDGSEYVDAILWYRAAEESGRTQSYGQGGTLLDALRALAAEIGGKNA